MPQLPAATLLRSLLASTARGWRGTQVLRRSKAPAQLLVVFDRENDPRCRLLRELHEKRRNDRRFNRRAPR